MTASRSAQRRGRPRAGEREARERAVLDTAMAELVEHGVEKMTMLSVAKRAGASKETLYSWFGNRDGLLRALIERNADTSAERVAAALGSTTDRAAGSTDDGDGDSTDDVDGDPLEILTGYATGLLTLLTAAPSVALNRAAMSDPELATVLLQGGRHRVGPIVERFLADQAAAGRLQLALATGRGLRAALRAGRAGHPDPGPAGRVTTDTNRDRLPGPGRRRALRPLGHRGLTDPDPTGRPHPAAQGRWINAQGRWMKRQVRG